MWVGMGVHTYHAPDRVQREKILWPRLGHVQGVKVKPGGGGVWGFTLTTRQGGQVKPRGEVSRGKG